MMIHNEYNAKFKGNSIKIGILGENHCYRQEEITFAERVVDKYGAVVSEGGFNSPWALGAVIFAKTTESLLFGKSVLGLALLVHPWKRYYEPPKFKEITRENDALYFETKDLTIRAAAGYFVYSIRGHLFAPINIAKSWFSEDRSRHDTVAGRKLVAKGEDGFVKLGKINNWLLDMEKRDKIMGKCVLDALELPRVETRGVLIRCGLAHGIGIKRTLEEKLGRLELVKTEHPVYQD